MNANTETWFEVKIDRDLALLFQRIVNVHSRIGKARRADLLARLAAAIPDGAPSGSEHPQQEMSRESLYHSCWP